MYRPTIYIQDTCKSRLKPQIDVARCWAGSTPPKFTKNIADAPDAAILHASTVEELLEMLPTLLQLHAEKTPALLLCDHQDFLEELTSKLDIIVASTQIDGATASGILFGMLQREDEVSILRSKVGLMASMRSSLQEDIDQMNDDLNSAALLQQEFMSSHTDPVHSIYFNTLWRPTGVVSGDMYDVSKLDDDHISFFIADAIGHGMPAAMLAMAISKALTGCRTDINGVFTSPSEVLATLNQAILDRNGNNARFATAMYGVINCKTRTLTIAGAGHPAALWMQGSSTTKIIESEGPLLGIFKDADFPQSTVTIGENDRVIFYSDGFEDALEQSNIKSGLPSHLQAIYNIGCQNDNIVEAINTLLDGKTTHHDDLTMLCLHAPKNLAKFAA
jgi:serine phosphatase RsbU (regulator of sigma subunit)|tara:strand:+ start:141 stop:1310 length:1170 start_codon:yes stop_codon:yes gene_type:complete